VLSALLGIRSLCAPVLIVALSFVGKASATVPVAGAYEFQICTAACSFGGGKNVQATGILVLFSNKIPQSKIDRFDLMQFQWHAAGHEVLNGCFRVKVHAGFPSYVGLHKYGLLSWSVADDSASIDLQHGADAGYRIGVTQHGNQLIGEGISWGAGVARPDFGPDVLIARRIGIANTGVCLSGAKTY
jgi:hypothetical protein